MFSTFLLYFLLGSIVVLLFFVVKLLIDLVSGFKAFVCVMLMPDDPAVPEVPGDS